MAHKIEEKTLVIIGSRGSKLAMTQTEWVRDRIKFFRPDLEFHIKKISTSGDKITDVPLAKAGGKGLFTKEIENELLSDDIDLAVHSMKDLPTELPKGLTIGVVPLREDARDVLVSRDNKKFRELPDDAVIGTCSLRRRAQLLAVRPGLQVTDLRGNLDTRLRKIAEGKFDAVVLACAGIRRLGRQEVIADVLDLDVMIPAVGQGALCIEIREGNPFVEELLRPLNHAETERAIRAERALMAELEGGCQVPVGGHARMEEGTLMLYGVVASLGGERLVRAQDAGNPDEPEELGKRVAARLMMMGAKEILDEIKGYEECPPTGN
ncbi:MAG: hydroxymethylbilane synthase [Candidatus Abyssobacteria bacterium SURF_17]|uniref:Porphobilinogen deaminase n=1 Tax=Candidatus Abyssobacteria bacterium SURF_17 TaxID=2093361 RepID=A0A419F1K0_9BACT|nr:MAG: hydroxymethylbilane synthase [Candidatus Abyssubacteria bacterium SURF_17]